ncbi:MAG: RNA 2'-phosphotransferase [Hydrogenophaga sp.]|nr:RNA 2'-phosphotransferase [Hydrogenophaga sp.]
MNNLELSKLLSRILRHRPDAVGVHIDRNGWCDVGELLTGLTRLNMHVTLELLERVVQENDKRRFVVEGNRIRAAQGHSLPDVEPVLRQKKPPSLLFHGTTEDRIASIEREGLRPMRRHHVHLSPDENTARSVGSRRGPAVVFAIDSARMQFDGHKFFVSDNGVWLTDAVSRKYLSRLA